MARWKVKSGDVKIELGYDDRRDHYNVRVCAPHRCQRMKINPPRHMTKGVDHPSQIAKTARAALAFAREDISQYAAMGERDYIISKRRPAGRRARRPRRSR